MKDIVIRIEKKYHEKLMVYNSILDILRKEKKSIINGDVTALWRFSSEKQKFAKDMERIREEMIAILDSAEIEHNIGLKTFELKRVTGLFTGDDLRCLTENQIVIDRVKKQIQVAGKLNLQFIQEYLATISDLVDVVVGNTSRPSLYNNQKGFARSRENETVLIRREV